MTPLTLYHKNKIEYVNVPCDFIDHYLMDAPGEFVKIYLYLLRCMEAEASSPSLSDVADKFNFTENDVLRALKYWEKKQLLSLIYNEEKLLCGVDFYNIACSQDKSAQAAVPSLSGNSPAVENQMLTEIQTPADSQTQNEKPAPAENQPPVEARAVSKDKTLSSLKKKEGKLPEYEALSAVPKKHYTKAKLSSLTENPEVKQMLFIAEQYLGTSFNPAEMETLLYIYDSLGFSLDLIEYLLGVCVEKQITSLNHIESIAVDWFKKGVASVKDAKKTNSIQRKTVQAVCGALGIEGRTLAEVEQMFLIRWTGIYGFSLDFILEACHRTIQTTGRPSFQYIDTILKNWQDAGVTSMADVKALDTAHQAAQTVIKKPASKAARSTIQKNKGNSFPERSYDYSALEQQLLNL